MAKGLMVAVALGLVAALSWANWPEAQLPEGTRADRILLRKSEHVLELYSGKTLLRSYRVAIGRGPILPKVQKGDARTPATMLSTIGILRARFIVLCTCHILQPPMLLAQVRSA